MALVINGVSNEIDSNDLPGGYTKPVITKFPSSDTGVYFDKRVVSMAKSLVENATKATTVVNIVAEVSTQLAASATADQNIAGKTVTIFGEITKIATNQKLATELFSNVAATFEVSVDYFVKVE